MTTESLRAEYADRGTGSSGPDVDSIFDLLRRPRWFAQAACVGMDPEAFFPARGESQAEAKDVCRSCTVQADCLEYALSIGEKFGVWGGTSERERRQIRKTRRAAAGTPVKPAPHSSWRRSPEAIALHAERRDLIALLYCDGMRPAEIAAVALMPKGTVDNQISAAGVRRHREAS